ncbi:MULTISPECIES: hypothetical protein [unclassified Ensifer]|uniref:hypothetical protein n=1 Tax=unclassified Ensifer TaxID=2633371 RepID=UPI0011128057|nr:MULTISPECIES: hypothetical protein [unclassified Ensifer]
MELSDSDTTSPGAETKSGSRTLLDLLKEWGGLATLVIALLYTFPFSLVDRYFNAQRERQLSERDAVAEVRRAIADMAALRAEKASRFVQSSDPRYQNEIASAYDIRIYNVIYTQKENFRSWSSNLRSSELYWIGSSLTLIGEVGEAQYYYDSAISAAEKENIPGTVVTVRREKGNSLFLDSPNQDLEKARSAYLEAIKVVSGQTSYNSRTFYVSLVSELVSGELLYGSYQCGRSNVDMTNFMFGTLSNAGVPVKGLYDLFNQNVETSRPRAALASSPCNYSIPRHSYFK